MNEEVTKEEQEVRGEFLDESLLFVVERPWFTNISNYKSTRVIPQYLNWNQQKKFLHDICFYIWDDPHLFKIRVDNLLKKCVTREEAQSILWHYQNSPYGGHYGGDRTTIRILQARFFWPSIFKDAHDHVLHCDQC